VLLLLLLLPPPPPPIIIIIIIIIIVKYTNKHSDGPSYSHWTICKHNELQVTDMCYEHIPAGVFNVNGSSVTWNVPFITG